MNRNKSVWCMGVLLLVFSVVSTLAVPDTGVHAFVSSEKEPMEPGTYDGTFIYTIEHAYSKSGGEVIENTYRLRAEEAMGTIRFRVTEVGAVSGVSIRFEGFYYTVNETQTINVPEGSQGEYRCTGHSTRGAGMGSVSGGSGSTSAPSLSPTARDFQTRPIKLNAGEPWASVKLTGKCPPGTADSDKAAEAIKWDIDSVPASPWFFSVTWQGPTSVGGTCTTDYWAKGERSMTCYWAAYSNGYKRRTAPGP